MFPTACGLNTWPPHGGTSLKSCRQLKLSWRKWVLGTCFWRRTYPWSLPCSLLPISTVSWWNCLCYMGFQPPWGSAQLHEAKPPGTELSEATKPILSHSGCLHQVFCHSSGTTNKCKAASPDNANSSVLSLAQAFSITVYLGIYFKTWIRKDWPKDEAIRIIFVSKDTIYNKARSSWPSIKRSKMWGTILVTLCWAYRQEFRDSLPHFKYHTPVICRGSRAHTHTF